VSVDAIDLLDNKAAKVASFFKGIPPLFRVFLIYIRKYFSFLNYINIVFLFIYVVRVV